MNHHSKAMNDIEKNARNYLYLKKCYSEYRTVINAIVQAQENKRNYLLENMEEGETISVIGKEIVKRDGRIVVLYN